MKTYKTPTLGTVTVPENEEINRYRIESTAGLILGEYDGTSETDALNALAQDAGYSDIFSAPAKDYAELIVKKIS